jgi:hypothetical protein
LLILTCLLTLFSLLSVFPSSLVAQTPAAAAQATKTDQASQPPAAAKPATSKPGADDYSKESVVIEQSVTKISFQNDGTDDQQNFTRLRVQSQAGIQKYGVVHFFFPSAIATMDVQFVRVIKPDGSVVRTPLDNIIEMPAEITR